MMVYQNIEKRDKSLDIFYIYFLGTIVRWKTYAVATTTEGSTNQLPREIPLTKKPQPPKSMRFWIFLRILHLFQAMLNIRKIPRPGELASVNVKKGEILSEMDKTKNSANLAGKFFFFFKFLKIEFFGNFLGRFFREKLIIFFF